MKLIFKYCKQVIQRYTKVFLRAMGLIIFITLLNSLIPYGMRLLLNRVVERGELLFAAGGLAFFAVYLTLKTLIDIKWYVLLDELGGRCITDLSMDMESALAKTSQSNIDEEKSGRLKHIMYADILDVFRVVGHHIPTLLGSVTVILASLVLAAFYDWRLSLFIFGALIVGMLLSFSSRKIIAAKAGATNRRLKEHHALCDQYVDSLPLVQTNPVLPYFLDRTKESVNEFIHTSQKEDGVHIFWTETVSNYHTLFTLALSTLLALPAAGGSIVNLVFFITLSDIIMSEGQKAELLIQQIMKALPGLENVDRVLKLPPRQGDKRLESIEEIVFDKVDFAYQETGDRILEGFDETLKKGENIRIAGSNGSGKSTFIKLVNGVYSPTNGEIRINGEKLAAWSQASLQEQVLYINQDETLLNESLKTYLELVGERPLGETEAEMLFRQLEIKDGDRKIENNGLTLSMGQRKKLLLLKLMLRWEKASVIILDELEAGLDEKTRKLYITFLSKLFQDRKKTVLVIEHESNAELTFDRVIAM